MEAAGRLEGFRQRIFGAAEEEGDAITLAQASQAVKVIFSFTNMCKFPFYEEDFGWGTPDRVINIGSPLKNIAYFMETKSGGGIELLIQLPKSEMDKIEARLMLKSRLKKNKMMNVLSWENHNCTCLNQLYVITRNKLTKSIYRAWFIISIAS